MLVGSDFFITDEIAQIFRRQRGGKGKGRSVACYGPTTLAELAKKFLKPIFEAVNALTLASGRSVLSEKVEVHQLDYTTAAVCQCRFLTTPFEYVSDAIVVQINFEVDLQSHRLCQVYTDRLL